MTWRVLWRERTPNGTPSTVNHEDGHDRDGALFKARQVIERGAAWCWMEDLDSPHSGNSTSKPKLRTKPPKKAAGSQPQ